MGNLTITISCFSNSKKRLVRSVSGRVRDKQTQQDREGETEKKNRVSEYVCKGRQIDRYSYKGKADGKVKREKKKGGNGIRAPAIESTSTCRSE